MSNAANMIPAVFLLILLVLVFFTGFTDWMIVGIATAIGWGAGSNILAASIKNLPTDFVDFDVKKKKD